MVNGTYVYNALGQRMQKTAAGTTLRFMYDEDGHLLGEYGTSGAAVQETIYLGAGRWPPCARTRRAPQLLTTSGRITWAHRAR